MSKCYASAVVAVAIGELGYVEKASNSQLDDKTANPGSANWTKYARDFDEKYPKWYNGKKNGYEWCDMFVDWCFVTAFGYENALRLLCQPERSCGAGCTWSAKYYKQKGQFFTSNPQAGDQIFFGTSMDNCTHTGLVEKVDASKVYTIEGNTNNRCARRTYSLNDAKIVGYGRPKYDGVGTTRPSLRLQPSTGGQASGTNYKIGDIVQFKGTTHYVISQATNGVPCKPGKAKVTSIAKGAKHPYHLVNQGGGCTVYGWVNTADIGARLWRGAVHLHGGRGRLPLGPCPEASRQRQPLQGNHDVERLEFDCDPSRPEAQAAVVSALRCTVCGKEIEEVKPCIYNQKYGPTCDECCQKCHDTEPFPCPEYDQRHPKQEKY